MFGAAVASGEPQIGTLHPAPHIQPDLVSETPETDVLRCAPVAPFAPAPRGARHDRTRNPDSQIALSGVTKRCGDRLLLDRLDLTVAPGSRAGVIGDNGSGKSTLLRLIAGLDAPDNGEVLVRLPNGAAYLPQDRHTEEAPAFHHRGGRHRHRTRRPARPRVRLREASPFCPTPEPRGRPPTAAC